MSPVLRKAGLLPGPRQQPCGLPRLAGTVRQAAVMLCSCLVLPAMVVFTVFSLPGLSGRLVAEACW
jgi:hypothetical protein